MARFITDLQIDPETDHELSLEGKVRLSTNASMDEWTVLADAVRDAILAQGKSWVGDPRWRTR